MIETQNQVHTATTKTDEKQCLLKNILDRHESGQAKDINNVQRNRYYLIGRRWLLLA